MYTEHFGLNEKPFSISPDPRYLYLSQRHADALAHLLYGISESGGFIQLTGEVGTGKTTLIRSVLRQLPERTEIALILNPKLSAKQFLQAICQELRVPIARSDTAKSATDRLNERLLELHADSRRVVLIVDEAQTMSPELLEQVRLLTNLETEKQKLLQIILIGQPELREILGRPEMRQVAQRITGRYHLEPLTAPDSAVYVSHRLKVAGGRPGIFSKRAIRKLFRLSRGIPRLINIIADRALLAAYARDQTHIGASLVGEAADEVLARPRAVRWWPWAAVLAGLAMLFWASAFWDEGNSGDGRQLALAEHVDSGIDTGVDDPDPQESLQELASEQISESQSSLTERASEASSEPQPLLPEPVSETATEPRPSLPKPASESAAEPLPSRAEPTRETATAPQPSLLEPTSEPLPAVSLTELLAHSGTSVDDALKTLFALWGADYAGTSEVRACDQAESQGLKCLTLTGGSISELAKINRPAMLELKTADGTRHHVVLLGLDESHALVSIAASRERIPISELAAFTHGVHVVLFRPAIRDESGTLAQGARGPGVIWLRTTLDSIGYQVGDGGEPDLFDAALEAAVRDYQRDRRLFVDGVVGDRTLISLQSDIGIIGVSLESGTR
jgi:general secretion pathway protein A